MSLINESNRVWWALGGCCLGLAILMLDSTVVTLALPAIESELGASAAALQWVVNAYLLALAVMVVTASRFGDMFGRKRVYLIGLVTFGFGAIVSATADDPAWLVAGRIVQGLGGAAVVSLSLALVSAAFPPARRPTALGIWAGVSAIALAIGPLVGGVIVHSLSWRWVFWLMLPFVVIGALITHLAIDESRDEQTTQEIDWVGLGFLTTGIIGLILPLVQGEAWGWSEPRTYCLLLAGVGLLAAFWVVEHRVSNPIVDFSLFRNRPYFGASMAAFTLMACWWVVIFYQPQYLQKILGYTPIEAGLLILPITIPMAAISPFDGRLMRRFGARTLMTVGMSLATLAMLILTQIDSSSGYGLLLPAYLIFGVSLGLVYAPMSNAAMAAMPPEKAGIAAGVLGMNRMFSGAFSVAAAGAIFQNVLSERADEGVQSSFTAAISHSIWVSVALAAVGTVLTWKFVRSAKPDQPGTGKASMDADLERDIASRWHRSRHHL